MVLRQSWLQRAATRHTRRVAQCSCPVRAQKTPWSAVLARCLWWLLRTKTILGQQVVAGTPTTPAAMRAAAAVLAALPPRQTCVRRRGRSSAAEQSTPTRKLCCQRVQPCHVGRSFDRHALVLGRRATAAGVEGHLCLCRQHAAPRRHPDQRNPVQSAVSCAWDGPATAVMVHTQRSRPGQVNTCPAPPAPCSPSSSMAPRRAAGSESNWSEHSES